MSIVRIVLGALVIAALATPAVAGPRDLSDAQMDRITAGDVSVDVGADASAIVSTFAYVDLSESAQEFALGLNVVNSSDSLVANAVNVFSGDARNQDNADNFVDQINLVDQLDSGADSYVGGDGSSIDVLEDNTVVLTGFAQSAASALNLVNAAASIVGNAVNVSVSSGVNNFIGDNLVTQSNEIIQTR